MHAYDASWRTEKSGPASAASRRGTCEASLSRSIAKEYNACQVKNADSEKCGKQLVEPTPLTFPHWFSGAVGPPLQACPPLQKEWELAVPRLSKSNAGATLAGSCNSHEHGRAWRTVA